MSFKKPEATVSDTNCGGFVVVAGVVTGVGLAGVSVPQFG